MIAFDIEQACKEISAVCASSNIASVKMLPDLIHTIYNIADDSRSDWYMHALCNSFLSFAGMELNGSLASAKNVAYAALYTLDKISSKSTSRMVLENLNDITSTNYTLNAPSMVEELKSTVDVRRIGTKLGEIDDTAVGKCYNYYKQSEEQAGLDRDKIVLYVKLLSALKIKPVEDLFDDYDYYCSAMVFFAERGILSLSADVVPPEETIFHYLKKDADNSQSHLVATESLFQRYFSNMKKEIWSINHPFLKDFIDIVERDLSDEEFIANLSAEDRMLLNSAIAYIFCQSPWMTNGLRMESHMDVLYMIAVSFHSIYVNKTETDGMNYDIIKGMESLAVSLEDEIIEIYGLPAMLDFQSRTAFLRTRKSLEWIALMNGIPYLEFLKDERSMILQLTRMIDKNICNTPRYKNRLCIDQSLTFEDKGLVDEVSQDIANHRLQSRIRNRERNKSNLDYEDAMLGDLLWTT